jgi:hypothetical protein
LQNDVIPRIRTRCLYQGENILKLCQSRPRQGDDCPGPGAVLPHLSPSSGTLRRASRGSSPCSPRTVQRSSTAQRRTNCLLQLTPLHEAKESIIVDGLLRSTEALRVRKRAIFVEMEHPYSMLFVNYGRRRSVGRRIGWWRWYPSVRCVSIAAWRHAARRHAPDWLNTPGKTCALACPKWQITFHRSQH